MNLPSSIRKRGIIVGAVMAACLSPLFGQDIDRLEQVERERRDRIARYEGVEPIDHGAYHGRLQRYDLYRRDPAIVRPYSPRHYRAYPLSLYHRRLHLGSGSPGVNYYHYGSPQSY